MDRRDIRGALTLTLALALSGCWRGEPSAEDAAGFDAIVMDDGGMATPEAGPRPDSSQADMRAPVDMSASVDMRAIPVDAALPDAALPDAALPDATILDMARPDATILDMARPDAALPDMAAPDMAIPDMAIPDMALPDMALPDMALPDMALPDMALPDMALPDMALPDMAIPDMALPDMADPCAALACDTPPPADCVDDGRARRYDALGACVVDEGAAGCVYGAVEIACEGEEICDEGACGPPPPPRPGELIITEFMPDPHGPLVDRLSQWVEIQNVSARPLPLLGCSVLVDRGEAALDGVLDPGAVLLVGNGDDPEFNGALPIAAVFNATLSVRGGTLSIVCGPADPPARVDQVIYGRAPSWPVRTGFATALDAEAATHLANDDAASWCLARAVYLEDPEGENRGTPGAPNRPCTEPVAFARHDRPMEAIGGPGSEVQVFGRMSHPGVTDRSLATDPSRLVMAEVGFGPDGSVPDARWRWFSASPNLLWEAPPDRPTLDEYQRFIELPDRGRYDLAWRFSVDGGRSWTLGDGDPPGSINGYQPPSAGDLRVEGVARVRSTGEVLISELFLGAGLLDANAQWVELHNPGAEPLDLTGCTLDSPDFQRAPLDGLEIAANGWLAIPRLADPARNGGIEGPVGFEFVLPPAGGSTALTCRFEIDRVRWDDGVLFQPVDNAALQLDGGRLDAMLNDDPAGWCPGEALYDAANGRRGTPGAANRACGALTGYPSAQLQRLFDVHCGECHLNGQSLGDLSLEVFEFNTFRIPSAQLPRMPLVTPSDRRQSYLWHKLSATHFDLDGAEGVQMPPGQPFQPGVIERIGLYIDALDPDAQP